MEPDVALVYLRLTMMEYLDFLESRTKRALIKFMMMILDLVKVILDLCIDMRN